jgi:hypothetical protein
MILKPIKYSLLRGGKMRLQFSTTIAILLMIASVRAEAYSSYDVDWPTSNKSGHQKMCITVDGCATCFFIKDNEFQAFAIATSDKESAFLDETVSKAIERSKNHCQ